MRPLPPRECRDPRGSRRGCAPTRVYLSHAWPPRAEVSTRSLALDPSPNYFVNAPDAPNQLLDYERSRGAALGGVAALPPLRLIVLLREPAARALSSIRMMAEWRWERANASAAIARDVATLSLCTPSKASVRESEAAAALLPHLSDRELLRYRECLARGNPLNHVRAGVYVAAALAWLRAFPRDRFLWLETEKMRGLTAEQLAGLLAHFTQLPSPHLVGLPVATRAVCEHDRSQNTRAADQRLVSHSFSDRERAHASSLERTYRPFNRLLRSTLGAVPELDGVAWLD